MYERATNSGHTVEWTPEDTDLAAEAMANVTGSGVSTKSEAKDNAAVDLAEKGDVARDVREEYARLVDQSTA